MSTKGHLKDPFVAEGRRGSHEQGNWQGTRLGLIHFPGLAGLRDTGQLKGKYPGTGYRDGYSFWALKFTE